MKFFTPEILEHYGSPDDPIADKAHEEWEAATNRYVTHLQAIEPKLPAKIREALKRCHFHDARVFGMGLEGSSFYINLQLDTPPHEVMVLHYRLALEPEVEQHPTPAEEKCPYLEWLYDEVDLVTSGRVTVFTHAILFTNGWELKLTFFDADYLVIPPLRTVLGPQRKSTPILSST